jgi:hypothetical protein
VKQAANSARFSIQANRESKGMTMNFDEKTRSLWLSAKEFDALMCGLSTGQNQISLSVWGEKKSSGQVTTGLGEVPRTYHMEIRSALKTLLNPDGIIIMHTAYQNVGLERAIYACSEKQEGKWVRVNQTGRGIALSFQSIEELQVQLGQRLVTDALVSSVSVNALVSPEVVLAAALIADWWRYDQLVSNLAHTAPRDSFTLPDLSDRLPDAGQEDYRWPLLFFEKVLPYVSLESMAEVIFEQGLPGLEELGIVSMLDDQKPELYQLTGLGKQFARDLADPFTKIGMQLLSINTLGEMATETVLLSRGNEQLWLLDVASAEGALAVLPQGQWQAFINRIFDRTQPDPLAVEKLSCPKCGEGVRSDAKFCSHCGADLA